MEIRFDCHVHTADFSCCGEDITVEKLVDFVKNNNVDIAITDHSAHLYYEREICWSLSKDNNIELFEERCEQGRRKIEEYLDKAQVLRKYGSLVGTELDILPDGQFMFEDSLLGELDLILGAVHFLPAQKQKLSASKIIEQWKWETEEFMKFGVDVLAHPFRILYLAKNQHLIDDLLICWLVQKAQLYDVALELNPHYQCQEPDRKMLAQCLEKGVKVAIGTDAHRYNELGTFSYHNDLFANADGSINKVEDLLFKPK